MAKQYFKIAGDDLTWIEFNGNRGTSIVLNRRDVFQDRKRVREALDNLPPEMSDEELLEWARENHPGNSDERQRLEGRDERLTELLRNMPRVNGDG